jgi:hypothetical protein
MGKVREQLYACFDGAEILSRFDRMLRLRESVQHFFRRLSTGPPQRFYEDVDGPPAVSILDADSIGRASRS